MLNRLTKTERVALIVLVTVIIWAIGIFAVIKPSMKKKDEAQSAYDVAESNKVTVDQKLASEKQIDNDTAKAEKEMKDYLRIFYKPTENFVVDEYIYGMLVKNQVAINSFSIVDAAVMPMEYYQFIAPLNSYPLGDYAKLHRLGDALQQITKDESTEGEATEETTDGGAVLSNESVEKQVITINFTSPYQNIKNFVQTVADVEQTINLTGLTASETEGGGQWQGSITLEYISVDYDDK